MTTNRKVKQRSAAATAKRERASARAVDTAQRLAVVVRKREPVAKTSLSQQGKEKP